VRTLGRFLFWDFSRGSWQYDVMVGLILAFIFLTPRDIFQDQPRAANVVILPSEPGVRQYWIAAELLEGVPPEGRIEKATSLVNHQFKARQTITRVEPVPAEKDVIGYMAYARP